MTAIFWISLLAVVYAYFGYPLLLIALRRRSSPRVGRAEALPTVSLLLPVHNEDAVLERKLRNTLDLDYPAAQLHVLVISDGSTDRTVEVAQRFSADGRVTVIAQPVRQGKAAALNRGLERARGDIIVFSDASIMLERESLRHIVAPFGDPAIGSVSGEDLIADGGGEGLYGRYELWLRRLESQVHSIVGASGSFYAQRRALCVPFVEGLAPDFLSVLNTVERGYRAVAEPAARGTMTSVHAAKDEFRRKVRTLIRGMTALFAKPHLLNPFRYGVFAIELLSHKLMRWLVPVFLVLLASSSIVLSAQPFYLAMTVAQTLFYALAALALASDGMRRFAPARIAGYFTITNAAILAAWWKFLLGVRQEIWTPSRRAP